MKIYQINYPNLTIEKYDHPQIELQDLNNIEKNSINALFGGNILEIVNDIHDCLSIIRDSLRLNGEFIISGINIDNICEDYLSNIIDINLLNKLITNKSRFFNLDSIIEIIKQYGLMIKTIKTDRVYYYIVITRGANK